MPEWCYVVAFDTYEPSTVLRFAGPFVTKDAADLAIRRALQVGYARLATMAVSGDMSKVIRLYPSPLTVAEARQRGMVDGWLKGKQNTHDYIPRSTDELFEMEKWVGTPLE